MGVIWTRYKDREEWLQHREGIGASEAGAVCGAGFKTPLRLWQEKTGLAKPDDLADNERVQFGNAIEEPMRGMFRVMRPEYELEFEPYTVLRRDDRHTFLFYTPDGWLTERATGRKGLYECKSATCLSAADWAKWNGKIPDGYYCQLLHGMYVGDYAFAVLFAILRNREGDGELRAYSFERREAEEDIRWLVGKEEAFWRCVERGVMPPVTLRV